MKRGGKWIVSPHLAKHADKRPYFRRWPRRWRQTLKVTYQGGQK